VVLSEKATLREIEESWTLKELSDAHEALDIMAEAEERAIQAAGRS